MGEVDDCDKRDKMWDNIATNKRVDFAKWTVYAKRSNQKKHIQEMHGDMNHILGSLLVIQMR